jgi:hypothetical protein
MQTIEKFSDRQSAGSRIIPQDIFLDRRPQAGREQTGIQAARVRRPRQEPRSPSKQQSVDLLLIVAQ